MATNFHSTLLLTFTQPCATGSTVNMSAWLMCKAGRNTNFHSTLLLTFTPLCAMGSAVNMSARLMCKAGRNEIWVDEDTRDACRLMVKFDTLQPVAVKVTTRVKLT